MKQFSYPFFVEAKPGKFDRITLEIKHIQDVVNKAGITIHRYQLVFPHVLAAVNAVDPLPFGSESSLDCVLTLFDRSKGFYKDFHAAGGKLYEVGQDGKPVTEKGPIKPADFMKLMKL